MRLMLHPNMHCAAIREDIILLDSSRSRYSAVPRHVVPSFQHMLSGNPVTNGHLAALAPYLGTVIVKAGDGPIGARARPSPVRRIVADTVGPASLFLLAEACVARLAAVRRIRSQPFQRIMADLRHAKSMLNPHLVDGDLPKVQKAFASACTLLGRSDQCLPMSIALARTLLRRRIPATLVIGVATGPFTAHCWVQVGDALVCDELDSVAKYTPILAV